MVMNAQSRPSLREHNEMKHCFVNSVQCSAMGEAPSGEDGAGGGVRARAAGAAAAAGGGAGCCGGCAQEVSLGGGRTPEGGASVRDGGAEDSAAGTGERNKCIMGDAGNVVRLDKIFFPTTPY